VEAGHGAAIEQGTQLRYKDVSQILKLETRTHTKPNMHLEGCGREHIKIGTDEQREKHSGDVFSKGYEYWLLTLIVQEGVHQD